MHSSVGVASLMTDDMGMLDVVVLGKVGGMLSSQFLTARCLVSGEFVDDEACIVGEGSGEAYVCLSASPMRTLEAGSNIDKPIPAQS